MAEHTIVVATDLTDEGLALLRERDDVILIMSAPERPALREHLRAADALIAREDVTVDAALIAAAPNLRIIARVGTNLGNLDIEAATNRGVIVMNTPGANAIAVGELTIALMLVLSRCIISAHVNLKEGWWPIGRKRDVGIELRGKTLGLVGLGRVGRVVAHRALAFGMTVLAYDPYVGEEQVDDKRILLVGFRELLERGDFISLHVPATSETRGMFDEAVIRQMKPGARLINTSTGSAIDEEAAARALQDGHLAGLGIDSYSEEPPYNSPLLGLDNVVHTPHIGDYTREATKDQSTLIAEQVLDALDGRDYRNVINMPLAPGRDFEEMRPYLQLAERIGTLQQGLARSPIRRVAVEYRGEEVSGMTKPLTVALLKGLLTPVLGEHVNYINAPILTAERGIQVAQAKGLKTGEYANLVSCQVIWEDGVEIVVSGTLLDRREPHIVQIDQYSVNFVPHGDLLIMGSYDLPGVIGRVGTMLAENNVNIASWHTARTRPGGNTLTILTLDHPIPHPLLEDLRRQEFVRHAVQFHV